MTNIVVHDPYAPGGLRVWDDYQFRRKGIKGGGQGPARPGVGPGGDTAPFNVVVPVITGRTADGQLLYCSLGAWGGTFPQTYAYQWYRVDTSLTSVSPPVVTGIEAEGRALTSTTGVWAGSAPITYAYQWYRSEDVLRRNISDTSPETITKLMKLHMEWLRRAR